MIDRDLEIHGVSRMNSNKVSYSNVGIFLITYIHLNIISPIFLHWSYTFSWENVKKKKKKSMGLLYTKNGGKECA